MKGGLGLPMSLEDHPTGKSPTLYGRLYGILLGCVSCLCVLRFYHLVIPNHPPLIPAVKTEWRPCFDEQDALCAVVRVPTDHDKDSYGDTYLSVSQIPADPQAGSRLGSVYTNFGGPGAAGRDLCFTSGRMIHQLVGGRFDIICWDPRGIGRTTPSVNCWGGVREQTAAIGGTVLRKTFEIPTDPNTATGRAVLVHQQKEALRLMDLQADVCGEEQGSEILKWMGTTTLIKDMEYLKNVIDGQDALINFHGGSYGTIVADYLANMLPDKVGAVIAHGVADPEKWGTEHYETYSLLGDLLRDADKTYQAFLTACHSAGGKCALSNPSDTAESDIAARVQKLLDRLYDSGGEAITTKDLRGILTSGMVRAAIFGTLQNPPSFKSFAEKLAPAVNAETPDYIPLFSSLVAPPELEPKKSEQDGFILTGQGDLKRLAVSCADAPRYVTGEPWPSAEEMVDNLLKESVPVSGMFGATVNLMEQHGGCQYWPKSEKLVERFTGPWNATLRTPMLVVSNDHDPITPVREGRKMVARHGLSAKHVIQKGIGHSYLVTPTECYAKIVKAYFEDGILPKDDEVYCDSPEPDYFA